MSTTEKFVDKFLELEGKSPKDWYVSRLSVNGNSSRRYVLDQASPAEGSGSGSKVSVTLSKRELPQININKISLRPTSVRPKASPASQFSRALILPDAQIGFIRRKNGLEPFHDRRAMAICLDVARRTKPDQVVILGDWLDLPDWTDKFFRDPNMASLTNTALAECAWWIWQFKRHCKSVTYISGNHCARIDRLVGNDLPQAWGLKSAGTGHEVLSVPSLLGLNDKDWFTYLGDYPNGKLWLNENLKVSHGNLVGRDSLESVRKILASARCSEIVGHIHRIERASKTVWRHGGPVTYTAVSPGCLCRLDGPTPRHGSDSNWQNGFAEVDYASGDGVFQIQVTEIYNGECLTHGVHLKGEALYSLPQIQKETRVSDHLLNPHA